MFDFLKSLHLKAFFSDVGYSLKTSVLSSPKRIAIVASVGVVLVSLFCVDMFFGPESGKTGAVSLKVPKMTDTNGDKWSLELLKGQSGRVFDAEGAKPGPPLVVKTSAEFRGGIIEVGVTMEGQAGEKYVPGAMINGKWADPPKFELVSEKGKVLASGTFEYG